PRSALPWSNPRPLPWYGVYRLHCRIDMPPSASDRFREPPRPRGATRPMDPVVRESPDRPARFPKFGAHMSIAGGCDRAVWAAHAIPFQTVQLFTKNNNRWNGVALTKAHAQAFRSALTQTGIRDPVAHSSYLINVASPDEALWRKSIDAMVEEIERC